MSKRYCDLIYKLVIVLSLEYLLFFGMEAILPGIIVSVFNINILLILVVGLLGVLLKATKCQEIFMDGRRSEFLKLLAVVASVFLVLVMIIVWHKLSLILIVIYILVSFSVGYVLWKSI